VPLKEGLDCLVNSKLFSFRLLTKACQCHFFIERGTGFVLLTLGKPDKEASAMDSSPEAASNVSDRISTNYVL
jgi:hypothetical protein